MMSIHSHWKWGLLLLVACLTLSGCVPATVSAPQEAAFPLPESAASSSSAASAPEPKWESDIASTAEEPESSLASQYASAENTSSIADASPASDAPSAETAPTFSAMPLPPEIQALITGSSWKEDCPVPLEELRYLQITCVGFDGETFIGEMIVHQELALELLDIFRELYEAGYPIANMRLIDHYGADDNRSMVDNNSYAFCSRLIAGTSRFSHHSVGAALDLNPVQNPYIVSGQALPPTSSDYLDRENIRLGMIVEGDACYNAFVSRGWSWGGSWPSPDYQHFEKQLQSA